MLIPLCRHSTYNFIEYGVPSYNYVAQSGYPSNNRKASALPSIRQSSLDNSTGASRVTTD